MCLINAGSLESTSQSLQESTVHTQMQLVARTTDGKL